MVIPSKYSLTPKITQLLQQIEAAKEVINSISISPEIETNIRRQSTLKSSLFSARIEGNTLTMDSLSNMSSQTQQKKEVFNILKALNHINQINLKKISVKDILNLHKMVLEGLVSKLDIGQFRTEPGAIFNSTGQVIYLPPRPAQILPLINNLILFINSKQEQFIPIKASIAHYTFEKIHPFLDGNGRVGRLLIQIILTHEGYGMKGIFPLEEYLDNHRAEYYSALETSEKDVTEYVEFMLEAMRNTAISIKNQILNKQETNPQDFLLPRRAEILNIIKDQEMVNFDQIRRRFLAVNERTLRFDLKKLADAGLIKKLGTTKGVYYKASIA